MSEHRGRLDDPFVSEDVPLGEEEAGEELVPASALAEAERERDEFLDMGRRLQA